MDVADVLDVIDDVPTNRDVMDVQDVVDEDATVMDVPDAMDVPDVRDVMIPDVPDVMIPDVPDTGVCPTGQLNCGSGCVDTVFSPTNCGACGVTCAGDDVCRMGRCTLATDCEEARALRGFANRRVSLDTDNNSATAGESHYCEVSNGRGWTVVFEGATADMSRSFNFQSSAEAAASWRVPAALAAASTRAMFAYRNTAMAVTETSSVATFDTPMPWRMGENPFNVTRDDAASPGAMLMVSVSVGGATAEMRQLRYGSLSPSVRGCGDPWLASTLGRICIVNTIAPFFISWADPSTDFCRNSDYTGMGSGTMAANTPCGMDRRFTIALSR